MNTQTINSAYVHLFPFWFNGAFIVLFLILFNILIPAALITAFLHDGDSFFCGQVLMYLPSTKQQTAKLATSWWTQQTRTMESVNVIFIAQ